MKQIQNKFRYYGKDDFEKYNKTTMHMFPLLLIEMSNSPEIRTHSKLYDNSLWLRAIKPNAYA